jgi:hypothetical protein
MKVSTIGSDKWSYMYSIVCGKREAEVYIKNGLDESYRLVCLRNALMVKAVENSALDYCREVGENFVMER